MQLEKTTETKHKELLALLNPLIDFMMENNNHKRDNLVDIAGYAALIEKL